MKWLHHKKNSFLMLYGFEGNKKYYDASLTLHIKNSETTVYGFISRIRLTPDRLFTLWLKLKELFKEKIIPRYLLIEVLPEHARFYRLFMPIVDVKKGITFDNLNCEVIKIDLSQDLRNEEIVERLLKKKK